MSKIEAIFHTLTPVKFRGSMGEMSESILQVQVLTKLLRYLMLLDHLGDSLGVKKDSGKI